MADESLLMLTRDVRAKTLRILEGVTEPQALFAPPGLQNSILWHAGHALIVVEYLSVSPAAGKPPVYPEGWFDKFNWDSKPASVKQWPTLAEVKAKLIDQAQRLTTAIARLSEQDLAHRDPSQSRDLRQSILHGLHDEACHQGEMWLLLKMQNKVRARDG